MKTARSEQMLVVVAATLVLSGAFGPFFHQHAPILPGAPPSWTCSEPAVPCSHSHLLPSGNDEADRCAICFFHRCASHGAAVTAQLLSAEFGSVRTEAPSGCLPDSVPSRPNEARGPPAV